MWRFGLVWLKLFEGQATRKKEPSLQPHSSLPHPLAYTSDGVIRSHFQHYCFCTHTFIPTLSTCPTLLLSLSLSLSCLTTCTYTLTCTSDSLTYITTHTLTTLTHTHVHTHHHHHATHTAFSSCTARVCECVGERVVCVATPASGARRWSG